MRKSMPAALLALAVSACAVGPDYQRPEIDIPTGWRLADGEGAEFANTAWWRLFQDPVLDQLVVVALQENKDLKIAAATVEEFFGLLRTTRADQFPQLNASALAERRRSSEETGAGRLPGVEPVTRNYQADLNLSFEIDLWGRLRRATEAARADLLATEEGRRTVILTLVAAVASNYIQLLELDMRLGIARGTLKTREESLRIAKLRFGAGITSELDVRQAESEYQATAVQIPQLERALAQQENALSLLLGRNPGLIQRGRSLDELALPGVPRGLPSELLERRPDIRQAEQELIAANARIGVARAAFFPSIALTGLLGSASSQLSNLFTGPARTWQYGGDLLAPIFTAGRLEGQAQAAEAVQQQALLRYEQAIQTAFSEVEDSLINLRKSREQQQAQALQVEALRGYLRLARLRYQNGYTGYLEVVDAERNLFEAELALAQTQSSVFLALVNLYRAMGGGWVVAADELSVAVKEAKPKGATGSHAN